MGYRAICQNPTVQNKVQFIRHNRIFHTMQTVMEIGICLYLGWGFLFRGGIVAESVRESLLLCANKLIPSLFCFMVFTSFLSLSGIGKLFAGVLWPVTRLLKLPKAAGTAVLMSFLGGYPIGAKGISDLYRRHEIDPKTANRMMIFCCCPAPSFVILAFGVQLLQSRKLGLMLYISQVLSALLLGTLSALRFRREEPYQIKDNIKHLPRFPVHYPLGTALVESVAFASSAMLPICGYVVLFGAFGSLLHDFGLPEKPTAFLMSFFEVTTGTAHLAMLSSPVSLAAISFFLAFGGLSVLFQINSLLGGLSCSMARLFFGRVVHGVLSAGVTSVLLRLFPQTLAVFGPDAVPAPRADLNTPLLTLCLVGMCSILMLSVQRPLYREYHRNK